MLNYTDKEVYVYSHTANELGEQKFLVLIIKAVIKFKTF